MALASRQISSAPVLPGFDFVELIGSGGYADVFLYAQQSPSRRVAVKVIDPEAVPTGAVADYTAEANLMAIVSAHPYIVQVFLASVAPDGRPFLVMEYYPGRNFYDRARHEHLSVAEVLRVGVQLASAIETAHRAGVLHRDIKPANVLTSEYRRPGLTDFGIAAVQGGDTADGLSIPWSPPEAMGDAPLDVRSDVYSLAATVYTLLAGRSPFEIRGGDNRPLALIGRIEHDPVPPTGRPDVPQMLERVLSTAMSKHPDHRPSSAAAFARQLQQVESELSLAVTAIELAEDAGSVRQRADGRADDGEATRVKGIAEVRAQAPVVPAPIAGVPRPDVASGAPVPERARQGLLAEPEVADTVHRRAPAAADVPFLELAPPSGVPKVLYVAIAAAAVLALVLGGMALRGGSGTPARAAGDVEADVVEVNDDLDVGAFDVVPALDPAEITITPTGTEFVFTWPSLGPDYSYAVTAEGAAAPVEVAEPTFTGPGECLAIAVIAPDGRLSATTSTATCGVTP